MKKILIIHPSMVGGGAEKVLINMLDSIDYEKYDVTLLAILDEGVNRKYINKNVKYKYIFKHHIKGYKYFLKLFTPKFLFKKIVKEKYDTIISYLEGPTTRILSGCNYSANLVSWIHTENTDCFRAAFRSKNEMINSYNRINKIVCVSNDVKNSFNKFTDNIFKEKTVVIKNVNNPADIIAKSKERLEDLDTDGFNIIVIGRLDKNKDPARLIPMIRSLNDKGTKVYLNILGDGEEYEKLKNDIDKYKLKEYVHLYGYQENPYKYLSKSNLYICCSHYEGYSTTVIESVILNIPVIATNCSGMKEILDHGKYGEIVNDDDGEILSKLEELINCPQKLISIKKQQKEKIKLLYKDYYNTVSEIEKLL